LTQIRSPISVALLFWVPRNQSKTAARTSAIGSEFLYAGDVLIAARHGAKVHQFASDTQRNRSLFRDVHSTDRIAHEPPRTRSGLAARRRTFAARMRIQDSTQEPTDSATQHCDGPAQYQQPNQKSHSPEEGAFRLVALLPSYARAKPGVKRNPLISIVCAVN
jgi:hypothetical protein